MAFPSSSRMRMLPQGMPASGSLGGPAARVRRCLEGFAAPEVLKRFASASLALPMADVAILTAPLRSTVLAPGENRNGESGPIGSEVPLNAAGPSEAAAHVPAAGSTPVREGRGAGRAPARPIPTESPDGVTLTEILGGSRYGNLPATGGPASASPAFAPAARRKPAAMPPASVPDPLQARQDEARKRIAAWLRSPETGWRYPASPSFWAKAPARPGALPPADSGNGAGPSPAPSSSAASPAPARPAAPLSAPSAAFPDGLFPDALARDPRADAGGSRQAAEARFPSAPGTPGPIASPPAASRGTSRNPGSASAGLPAAWQRALAAFEAGPAAPVRGRHDGPSAPGETPGLPPLPGVLPRGAAASPGSGSSQPVPPAPGSAGGLSREGLPERPLAPAPEVEWFAEEDLADRLGRILGRQARRRGIDLS